MATKKTPPRDVSTIELGLPGLDQHSGYIFEERHPKLQGRTAMWTYEEMSQNDPIIGAALYAIEAYLRKVKYQVRPADSTPEAVAEAAFVKSCMYDMDQSWGEFVSDAQTMLVYGFSLHETVYKYRRGLTERNRRFRSKYDDGRVGWRALSMRAQKTIDSWDIDPDTGEILGAWQEAPPNYTKTYLPMSKCVLFRTRSYKNNPEGFSVLRRAYRPWNMKKRLEEIEAIGIARDLAGLPVIEVPPEIMSPNATPAQKQVRAQMQRMVSLIARDRLEGMVFPSETGQDGQPSGYKVRLMSSGGSKQILADLPIRRYDSRIAMCFAAEFLMLGTDKTGSFAAASEHSGHFSRSLEWYSDVVCEAFNKTLIPRLMEVNGVDPAKWPTLTHEPVEQPNLQSLGVFLQQVATAGLLTPTPQVEAHLREMAQFPEPTDEEVVLMQNRPATTPPTSPPADPDPSEATDTNTDEASGDEND